MMTGIGIGLIRGNLFKHRRLAQKGVGAGGAGGGGCGASGDERGPALGAGRIN